MKINNLRDRNCVNDELVQQEKYYLPVVHKADKGMCYTKYHPTCCDNDGETKFEGLQLKQDYINAPESEHILIDFEP